ncbi:MAG: FeoA family protein [Cyanobacteria bacterium J06642_3]
MKSRICIDKLLVGSTVTIVGYNPVYGGYVGKLLAKGLTVGRSFKLLDVSNIERVLKMSSKGSTVVLSKPEADALYVTAID